MGLRYRRSRYGDVVHRADCTRARSGVPWNYADDFTSGDIVRTLANAPWLRACRFCRPDVQDTPP